ncbi:DNA polymerase I [candidate division KSB1 bacterium]
MAERLFIIDGTALVYRSYFSFIRNPLINAKGENTSAAFGFAASLLRLIRDERPDYLVVTFDSKEPTFRHEQYEDYKATRERMPDDLVGQLSRIDDVVDALNLPAVAFPGYEADDIMGTFAKQGYDAGLTVYLVTGDKDLMQLVNDRVFWMNIRKTGQEPEILDPRGVADKFGVPPEQVVEVLGLMGDASDNVPGVAGVGPKTALKLIAEYKTLEQVLDNADKIPQKGLREKLIEHRDNALLSKQLVTIDCSVPVKYDIDSFRMREPDAEKAVALFQELEFTSLLDLLPRPKGRVDAKRDYHTVLSVKDLQTLAENLKKNPFAFDLETTSLDPITADIVGFSFSWEEGEAWYVPAAAPDKELTMSYSQIVTLLKPVLEDETVPKAAQNAKFDMSVLRAKGVTVRGLAFDTMIASYLIDPDKRQHNLDRLSFEYLNLPKIPTAELIGSGKNRITMAEVPLDKIAEYACEDADHTFRLWRIFERTLRERGLERLFHDAELPLIEILMDMEFAGVSLDVAFLKEMSGKLHELMAVLEQEIYQLAGEEFNLNSPKELGRVLFEKLEVHKEFGVKRVRKTSLGYSTDISVLEQFQSHDVVGRILEYRQFAKLLSTYVDALPKLIHPRTGRVHTSFNQTVAATGRLSSSNPNLQNIPIRRAQGREIRKAFVPPDDSRILLSADYSQIELRIMAHLSEDEAMREAFRGDQDIHTLTASKIFNVDPDSVEPEMRYRAKAINFGIIYGMSRFRLAREVGISNEEAQDFIEAYFDTFPGVNLYRAQQIAKAYELGYVSTIMGRRRYIPELHSENQRVRQTAENVAINTPIQGTAAELIKVAMIKLHRRLREENPGSRLILQIHDELVLEVPKEEEETVRRIVRDCMEHTIELSIPLKIDMNSGPNWFEAH